MIANGTDRANKFLFVVWSKARPLEKRILDEISSRFKVLRTFEVSWPRRHFTANLAAFYGWKGRFCWWNKARKCGRGPFLAIEVEDPSPRWEHGADTSGHDLVLNQNICDLKKTLRAITGHSNRIHASMTCEETAHELAALGSADSDGRIPFLAMEYANDHDAQRRQHRLFKRIRRKWDCIIGTEGVKLGFSDCRSFLENSDAGGGYSPEELDRLLVGGELERIGMGSRRACYRLPGGRLCLKCYRSDAEIAEGKHPGLEPVKPLRPAVICEIEKYRFDGRRNTCCREYRYWLKLKERLPQDLFAVFPSEMSLVRLPTRGWALIEELVVDEDGVLSENVHHALLAKPSIRQDQIESETRSLIDKMAQQGVKLYDPGNILVQRFGQSFSLRIADFEPVARTVISIDSIFPAVIRFKTSRRGRKFLDFAFRYRVKTYFHREPSPKSLHLIRNSSGAILFCWTDQFISRGPELAAKVLPIPLDESDYYIEKPKGRTLKMLAEASRSGECAWMFYPSKRDDVRTVFFLRNGNMYVKKVVLKRAWRQTRAGFWQRECGPSEIFKGDTVASCIERLVIADDAKGVEETLARHIEAVIASFPLRDNDMLPEMTFDAIPQNSIISKDGTHNFFDLEYDMHGGVPLWYLICRSVATSVLSATKRHSVNMDYRAIAWNLCQRYDVTPDWREYWRICVRIKRFNTLGLARALTNIMLSLLPFRSLRGKFCWWSYTPKLRGICR